MRTVGRRVERVLLVDDSKTVLRAWQLSCQQAHKIALCAASRRSALDLAARERPDLAVVDLFLQEATGLEVIRDLKHLGVDAFIVLVSAHISVEYAMLAVHAGADDCYDKSISLKQIIQRVETGQRTEPDWQSVPTLREVEWRHIARVLSDCDGNISHAAEVLGEHRQSLQRKIHRYAPGALRVRAHRARRKSRFD
jgi:two-component system, response regulator RegA